MKKPAVGSVLRWDYQSDVFQGEYRVVAHLDGNLVEIENLAPSDQLIDEIGHFYATAEHPCLAPGESRDEAWLAEVERRQAWAGSRQVVRVVSREEWARAF